MDMDVLTSSLKIFDQQLRETHERIEAACRAAARANEPGTERGDVLAVCLHGDVAAAERLARCWRPWPFDPCAQAFLKALPPFRRAELLARLPQDIVNAARDVMSQPRRWRFGPQYKTEDGIRVECTARELTLTEFVPQVHNIARRVNGEAIAYMRVKLAAELNSRSLRDSDGARWDAYELLDSTPDDAADVPADPVLEAADLQCASAEEIALLERLAALGTPRQRAVVDQVIIQRKQGRKRNLTQAALALNIAPATAWVHWHNVTKRAKKHAA